MDAHGNAKLLGLGVERIEIRMIQISPGSMRRSRDGDKAQFFDAALELLHGFLRLLQRHQRDAFQALRVGLAIAVEPGVVAMRDGAGEIVVFEERQA